jgi:uncharacterized delta-60 repeat protein
MNSWITLARIALAAAALLTAVPASAQINKKLAVERLLSTGALDTSFHGDGAAMHDLAGKEEHATAVAIAAGNKIIVAGHATVGARDDYAVMLTRLNTDGSIDRTFGVEGVRVHNLVADTWDVAMSVAIDASGRLVVAGSSGTHLFIARYSANGSIDRTFGSEGVVRNGIIGGEIVANRVLIQSDGRIVVAGTQTAQLTERMFVRRYNADGTVDYSFSRDGQHVFAACDGDGAGNDAARDSQGRIVVAGRCRDGRVGIARLTSTGVMDLDFSGDGRVVVSGASSATWAYTVAVDSYDRVLVGGDSDGRLFTIRLTHRGVLDDTFGGDGRYFFGLGEGASGRILAMVLRGSKIIVSGVAYHPEHGRRFMTGRFLSDGTPDDTYAGDGIHFLNFTETSIEASTDVAVDGNGRIIAVGSAGDFWQFPL